MTSMIDQIRRACGIRGRVVTDQVFGSHALPPGDRYITNGKLLWERKKSRRPRCALYRQWSRYPINLSTARERNASIKACLEAWFPADDLLPAAAIVSGGTDEDRSAYGDRYTVVIQSPGGPRVRLDAFQAIVALRCTDADELRCIATPDRPVAIVRSGRVIGAIMPLADLAGVAK